jgi:hypothetical protein
MIDDQSLQRLLDPSHNMADEESQPYFSMSYLLYLTITADAQVPDANADSSKDVKAEEMGEAVRCAFSDSFFRF